MIWKVGKSNRSSQNSEKKLQLLNCKTFYCWNILLVGWSNTFSICRDHQYLMSHLTSLHIPYVFPVLHTVRSSFCIYGILKYTNFVSSRLILKFTFPCSVNIQLQQNHKQPEFTILYRCTKCWRHEWKVPLPSLKNH